MPAKPDTTVQDSVSTFGSITLCFQRDVRYVKPNCHIFFLFYKPNQAVKHRDCHNIELKNEPKEAT